MEADFTAMIYVIGDSHARSFANSNIFFPVFVGPGKHFCFVTEKQLANIKYGVRRVLKRLRVHSKVLLVFGEPDTRYYLGKGWWPWQSDLPENITDIEIKVSRSSRRYRELIQYIKKNFCIELYVLSVSPTERVEQNKYVSAFNNELRKFEQAGQFRFVDIEGRLLKNEMELNSIYRADEVHLNDKIQPIVLDTIAELSEMPKASDIDEVDREALNAAVEYNHRFGCYVLKPGVIDGFSKLFAVQYLKKLVCG